MLRLKKLAITGGIASGKSAVCRVLQELGAFVVDADAIVHELLISNTSIRQQVIRLLGTNVLQNGKLSRRLIADKVFNDSESLNALEQILHPAVFNRINELYDAACSKNIYKAFVAEIPLLFEIGQEKFYDAVIVVLADEEQTRKRYQAAGKSEGSLSLRMKRQMDPKEKAERADYVITNNGSFEELQKQVIKISTEVFSHE